jgi:hypothetical protein
MVHYAVARAAERDVNSPLGYSDPARLRESELMRVGRLTAADEAGQQGEVFQVFFVAQALGSGGQDRSC